MATEQELKNWIKRLVEIKKSINGDFTDVNTVGKVVHLIGYIESAEELEIYED
jgi:hypothetical protein